VRDLLPPAPDLCPLATTVSCPRCGAVTSVTSSHPITVRWADLGAGRFGGVAIGATAEATDWFGMIISDEGWAAKSWSKARSIEGVRLGEIHQCEGAATASDALVC
jgi:hypothetical protein